MPLYTQIERDGEPIKVKWGWWHVERMTEVAILEHLDKDPSTPAELTREFWDRFHETPLHITGEQTIARRDYHFRDEADGEEFSILKGDVLRMHR